MWERKWPTRHSQWNRQFYILFVYRVQQFTQRMALIHKKLIFPPISPCKTQSPGQWGPARRSDLRLRRSGRRSRRAWIPYPTRSGLIRSRSPSRTARPLCPSVAPPSGAPAVREAERCRSNPRYSQRVCDRPPSAMTKEVVDKIKLNVKNNIMTLFKCVKYEQYTQIQYFKNDFRAWGNKKK